MSIANQRPAPDRELTAEEQKVIDTYTQRFGYPPMPPLDYGHCLLSNDEKLGYARQGLRQGKAIDWSTVYAQLPEDAQS